MGVEFAGLPNDRWRSGAQNPPSVRRDVGVGLAVDGTGRRLEWGAALG